MNLFVTSAAALVGALLFERLRIPAGYLVGAMVGVAMVNIAGGLAFQLPRPATAVAYIGIGWLIGQSITRETVIMTVRNADAVAGVVLALLAVGGLVAYVLVKSGVVDPATAFLASSPGGLSQMAALGAAVGANAGFVATVHLVRVVTVVLLAPVVVRVLTDG